MWHFYGWFLEEDRLDLLHAANAAFETSDLEAQARIQRGR
jgi:hypothetical protein